MIKMSLLDSTNFKNVMQRKTSFFLLFKKKIKINFSKNCEHVNQKFLYSL